MKRIDIEGYERYSVSEYGDIWAHHLNRWLAPQDNGLGYLQIKLRSSLTGKRKNFYVHRLVALHYLDTSSDSLDVNHKDCNKSNNHYSNLEWVTKSQNSKHAYDNNRLKGYASKDYIPKQKENKKHAPKRKFEVSKKQLEHLIWNNNFTDVGKLFDVSANAIVKRAKLLGCSMPPRYFHNRSEQYKEKIRNSTRENQEIDCGS